MTETNQLGDKLEVVKKPWTPPFLKTLEAEATNGKAFTPFSEYPAYGVTGGPS